MKEYNKNVTKAAATNFRILGTAVHTRCIIVHIRTYNTSVTCSFHLLRSQASLGMSVLQLRRFLRAIGQSTVGLKSALTARVEKAVSSGAVQAYVDNTKGKPLGQIECGKCSRTTAVCSVVNSVNKYPFLFLYH